MLPTTHGFAWEGYFRSLQGSFMLFAGSLLVVLMVYWFARWFIKHMAETPEDAKAAHWWGNRIVIIVVIGLVVGLGWHMVSIAVANRMPRADMDRTGVYDQMQNLIKGK